MDTDNDPDDESVEEAYRTAARRLHPDMLVEDDAFVSTCPNGAFVDASIWVEGAEVAEFRRDHAVGAHERANAGKNPVHVSGHDVRAHTTMFLDDDTCSPSSPSKTEARRKEHQARRRRRSGTVGSAHPSLHRPVLGTHWRYNSDAVLSELCRRPRRRNRAHARALRLRALASKRRNSARPVLEVQGVSPSELGICATRRRSCAIAS